MNRRDFLKTTAALAALGAAAKAGKLFAAAPKASAGAAASRSGTPDMVAIKGGEPAQMFDMGIRELGGMGRFVKKGQSVVIKPNIGWDKEPEYGANTNPDLVRRVIEHCKEAGVSKIYVFDTTCSPWELSYKRSGIAEAAEKAGAIVVGGDSAKDKSYLDNNYVAVDLPNAKSLKKMKMHRLIRECDVFINIPILKHHGGAHMTCCMKNLMGIVSKDTQRYFHSRGLHQCIAEVCAYRKPDLNIVDAYRVMTKRGPRGVDLSDVVIMKYQMLGTDPVALDTAAARLIKFNLNRIGHIRIGESLGVGTTKLGSLNIKRITVS